ncbi:MAG: hypothetical protein PVI09_07815 [Anaerolineae bacterium]
MKSRLIDPDPEFHPGQVPASGLDYRCSQQLAPNPLATIALADD